MMKSKGAVFDEDYKQRKNPFKLRACHWAGAFFLLSMVWLWLVLYILIG